MEDQSAQAGAVALAGLMGESRAVVVLTGAGISTESGIPDFRSPGGLWTRYAPIDYGDFIASAEQRRESWRRRFAMDAVLNAAQPNCGHQAIAGWVAAGRIETVITQNIDGLHQRAGVPDERLIELHGNTMYAACLACARRHELAPIRAAFEREGTLPECADCGGLVKTATISFGQPMPVAAMRRAQAASAAADLFIAIGTSLVVQPAASLPLLAQAQGARLAILSRAPTDLDAAADLVLNAEIGATLAAVSAALD